MRTLPLRSLHQRHRNRGAALIVSLVLLVVITLMGLSGMRNTTLQERMSSNMYDRSLAMQAAEAALSAAEAALEEIALAELDDCRINPENIAGCSVVPPLTFTGNDARWTSAGDAFLVNADLTAGTPQYRIQLIFEGQEPNGADRAAGMSDAILQYGSGLSNAAPRDVRIYRITARSQVPDDDSNRAMVVLQTTVRRTI